jgi:hypothetical protein
MGSAAGALPPHAAINGATTATMKSIAIRRNICCFNTAFSL